jgi:hypothetical protein
VLEGRPAWASVDLPRGILEKEHKSAEYLDAVLKIAKGYVEGSAPALSGFGV